MPPTVLSLQAVTAMQSELEAQLWGAAVQEDCLLSLESQLRAADQVMTLCQCGVHRPPLGWCAAWCTFAWCAELCAVQLIWQPLPPM